MMIETSDIPSPLTETRNWFTQTPRDWDGWVALRSEAAASREARNSLRDWLAQQDPTTVDPAQMGLGLFAAGETGAALPHLRGCDDDLCKLLTGWCLDHNGDVSAAAACWQGLGSSPAVGAQALLWLLDLQLRGTDGDGAAETLQALRDRAAPAADVTYGEGVVAEANGDHAGAVASWRVALQLDPDHANARFRLAHRLDLLGEDAEALEHYQALQPGDGAAWIGALVNMGILYEDVDDHHAAVSCFQQVMTADPTNRRVRRYLADAKASLHQYYDESRERKADKQNAVMRIPVTDFELSVRARNCLQRMNIHTLGDLVQRSETELLAFKNFGETSLQEVKEILTMKGLRLGMLPTAPAPVPTMSPAAPPATEGDMQSMRIIDLDLSVRSRAALSTLGIATVGDLISTTEATLMSCKNFGQTSLDEIKSKLTSMGLTLN